MRFPLALAPLGPAVGPALLAAIALLVPGELACSSASPVVTLTPITGIVIPASELTSARGCGSESGKISKYAAVVSAESAQDGGTTGAGIAKGVYDCYADAVFTNLPYGFDGTARYSIEIRAFGADEYEAQKASVDELVSTGGVLDLTKFRALGGAKFVCSATLRLDVLTRATCTTQRAVPAPGVDGGTLPDGGASADASADAADASDAAGADASTDAAGD